MVEAARPVTGYAPPPVISVSALLASARYALERHIGLVWVGGEISNCTRAASGHLYFKLKDANAQVSCVLFRSKALGMPFALKDGLAVEVRAVPTMYEARGEFQLNVDAIRLAGVGALYERFLVLKQKLEAAGWFAPERKRALPRYPKSVGVVTSTRAAALVDVVTTLARRWPALRVVVYPASVQGPGAADELAAAIRVANARGEVDALIVCRGGGSLEDLWAFNEEILARAIFESRLPIVSGVGHETDFTICDFVADLRAPTPTGAAMLLAPDRDALAHKLEQWTARLVRHERHAIQMRQQRLDIASRRLVHPAARLAAQRERLRACASRASLAWQQRIRHDRSRVAQGHARLVRELRALRREPADLKRLEVRWRQAARSRMTALAERVERLGQHLKHLDPREVLTRGYSIVTATDGRIVQDAAEVAPGDAVGLTFAHGGAEARITKTRD
jgi:exodeoxyribonuclease VII large subunit